MRSSLTQYLLVAAGVCIQANAAVGELPFRVVAKSGQQAPGLNPGLNFSSNVNDRFYWPAIDNSGKVAFRASVFTGYPLFNNTPGIWSDNLGELGLVAYRGRQAAGFGPGINYDSLGLLVVLNDDHTLAYSGDITGGGFSAGTSCLWKQGFSGSSLEIREGWQAPGSPDGTRIAFTPGWHHLNNQGTAMLVPFLDGASFGRSILTSNNGSLTSIARTGLAAPGLPVGYAFNPFSSQFSASMSSTGAITFASTATLPGDPFGTSRSGIWTTRGGTLAPLALNGQIAPGGSIGEFQQFTSPAVPSMNGDSSVAFFSRLSNNNGMGIWSDRNGPMELVALSGPTSGMDGLTAPLIGGDGTIAYGSVDTSGRYLWLSRPNGTTRLITRTGFPAPGSTGTFLSIDGNNSNGSNPVFALNNAGQIAFFASLTGVPTSRDRGIWATDANGDLTKVLLEGDLLEIAPGEFKTVSDVSFSIGSVPNSTGGQDSRSRWFNDAGQMAVSVVFTDNSSAIVVFNVPESTSALLWLLALAPVVRRQRARLRLREHDRA